MSTRRTIDDVQARAMGARIREVRGKATQAEFASRLGVDRASLANYESGKRIPNDTVLKKISDISGIEISNLLFGEHTTPFQLYLSRVNDQVAKEMKERPGFIPRFTISDDELAVIKVIRLATLAGMDAGMLEPIVKAAEVCISGDQDLGLPPYGEDAVRAVREALVRGHLNEGYDPDAAFFATLGEGPNVRG